MKLIVPYIKQNLFMILPGIACMILVDGAQLLVPQIIKTAVDSLAAGNLSPDRLLFLCLAIAGLGLVMALLQYGWRVLLMGSARNLELGIRDTLFAHTLSLDAAFYDRFRTGDIMTHATSDINHVRMAFGFGIIVLVDTLLLGCATLTIMILTHPKLTLMALIPMPVLIYVTRSLGKKMHELHTTAQESFSLLTEMLRESFFGIRVIKVFNFEPLVTQKVAHASRDYFKKNLKRAVVMAVLRPLLGFFFNLSSLIILIYGGFLVIRNSLTPGELVAFLQYLNLLAWPVISIGWMTNLFQRGMASLKRITTLLESRPALHLPASSSPLPRVTGHIRFSGVSFGFGADRPVLSDICLDIPAGSRLGISGPPGAGKSTLIHLIPRLYDPSGGSLFIDGRPAEKIFPDTLRQFIALMPQEPFLFSTTLRENILMGRNIPALRLEQILHACALTRTLSEMPEGLETRVGERGVTLSGGQKQRVSLARTLVALKPILILDDPVSQMDTRTARHILDHIPEMTRGATCIIISHRLSALTGCHRIVILDKGRILDQGTHSDLMASCRFYRDAFRIQQFEATHGT